MKRIVIAALLIGALSGCNMKKHGQQKVEAYQRWSQARAGVVTTLAAEYLKAGELDKARTQATEALTMAPDHVPAMVVLAKVLIEDGTYARAVEELRIAEVQAADSPEVAYLLGVALEKRGDHAEALKCYQTARALAPSDDGYVAASAEVLVAMGQPARALELLTGRLDRRDGSPGLQALAGELAATMGLHKQAAAYFQDCLDAEPKSMLAREGLAKAHFFAGHYGRAADVLKTLAAHPDHQDKTSWIYIMLGDCQLALNHAREARDAYETAVGLDPRTAKVWTALAKATLALGDLPQAMLAARRALSLGGDSLDATVVLAYGLLRKGKSGEAVRLLAEAARLHPKDATVLCMLGRCYQDMGRNDQAASYYLKVLRADPEHPLARSLLSMTGTEAKGVR